MNGHPPDLAIIAVGDLDSRFDDIEHDRCDITSDPVALDIRNDRKIRDVDRMVRVDRDSLAVGGHIDMIVVHGESRGSGKACIVQIVEDHKKC